MASLHSDRLADPSLLHLTMRADTAANLAHARVPMFERVCVCVCVQASHLLLTQLQDQVDIPMDSVSCSLQKNLAFFV